MSNYNDNNNNTNNNSSSNSNTAGSSRNSTSKTLTGIEVSCKGYINFQERLGIDLKFIAFEQIGSGTFGKIHRIRYEGQDRALKIVLQDPEYCNRELQLLEQLRNIDNIIYLMFSYFTRFNGKIYLNLITELLSHTLYTTIYSSRNSNPSKDFVCSRQSSTQNNLPLMCMTMSKLQKCFKGIFTGLKHMHAKNIAHRDLKPENIGITFDGVVKIIDMGSAKILLPKIHNTHEVCTLLYRAPELLMCNTDYSVNIDVWAIGCILAECLASKPLFFQHNAIFILKQIVSVIGRPPKKLLLNVTQVTATELQSVKSRGSIDKEYLQKNIIKPNLSQDPQLEQDLLSLMAGILTYSDRISASQALESAFLTTYYGTAVENLFESPGPSFSGVGQRSESIKHKMSDDIENDSNDGRVNKRLRN